MTLFGLTLGPAALSILSILLLLAGLALMAPDWRFRRRSGPTRGGAASRSAASPTTAP
jgi:hypothetical protein